MPDDQRTWSINQVVAFRLKEARGAKKQTEAAKVLEPYLGKLWTQTNFSAAERTVKGEREREFKVSDVLAFSMAFGLPASHFLTPPDGVTIRLGTADLDLTDPEVRTALLGRTQQMDESIRKLEALLERIPAQGFVEDAEHFNRQAQGGDIRDQRQRHEMEEVTRRQIEMGLDPEDPARPLEEEDEGEGTA